MAQQIRLELSGTDDLPRCTDALMQRVQRDRAHNLLSPNYQGQNATAGLGVVMVTTEAK